MTAGRIRVVALMTHPVQYLSPWFRHIHIHAPMLEFSVVYATEATADQQGVGFGRAFEWDVPLREGYESIVVRPPADGVSLDSDRFMGINIPEVVDAVRRLRPDVVLVSGWHSVTQVRAIVALRRSEIPLLYRGDTHLGSVSRRWPRLSRARARWMLRHFSGFLAVGAHSRDYLRAMGVSEPAIVSSPHAVDNVAFRTHAASARAHREEIRQAHGFSASERVVLFAGKLTAIKRPGDVIDAAQALDGGAVLFVGDGPERAALEAYARARGVHAVFTGFMNQRQIVDAYVAADALMMPGRETWGLVANEALACGLPVVMSTDVGAAPDLVAPGVCEAVAPADVPGFARALSGVIDHCRNMGGATECEDTVERCSFDAATAGLVTAATFVCRNVRRPLRDAPARIVALGGNLVFAGGMERITFEAFAGLRRGGADVHALINSWSSRPIAELAEQADITWEVGHYNARLDGVFRHPVRMFGALCSVARASAHLVRLLARRRVTHVFAVDFRAVLLHAPALALYRLLGIPVLLRSGVAPTRSRLHSRLWRWIIRPLVTRHVANSAFTAAELRAIGVDSAQIVTIPNVAPRRNATSTTSVRRDRWRVAYVGQLIPEKGVLQLLDAIGLLVGRGYDVYVDVAGQMTGWAPDAVHAYRTSLQARAAQRDLEGRVRFLGWREDVNVVLQQASVHCCPSQPEQREGFGITVIEAKRAGIPSVVCPSGALPELIRHGSDGWVTDGFDATSVAAGLEWLLADDARLQSAQYAAGESAKQYDPSEFERRWREEFGLQPAEATPQMSECTLASAPGASR